MTTLTVWPVHMGKHINQFISLVSSLCVKMNKKCSPTAGKHWWVSQWWCQKTVIEVKAQQSQILCSERQRRGEGAFECESARSERLRGKEKRESETAKSTPAFTTTGPQESGTSMQAGSREACVITWTCTIPWPHPCAPPACSFECKSSFETHQHFYRRTCAEWECDVPALHDTDTRGQEKTKLTSTTAKCLQ